MTGWSYLVVTWRVTHAGFGKEEFVADNGDKFYDKRIMLHQLGSIGWELAAVYNHEYYFKRSRA